LPWRVLQQHISTFQIVALFRRQVTACGVAQRVDCGVDFG
jgi:hypothetical protein